MSGTDSPSHTEAPNSRAAALVLLTDKPVAYSPALARAVGSVAAGVMLRQLCYWASEGDPERYFWKTVEKLEEETALSKGAQQTARRRLLQIGAIEADLHGMPPVWHYRIRWDVILALLAANPRPAPSGGIPAQRRRGIPPNVGSDSRPTSGAIPARRRVNEEIHEESQGEENQQYPADSFAGGSETEPPSKGTGRNGRVSQIMTALGMSPGQADKMAPSFTEAEAEAIAASIRGREVNNLGAYAARVFADHAPVASMADLERLAAGESDAGRPIAAGARS